MARSAPQREVAEGSLFVQQPHQTTPQCAALRASNLPRFIPLREKLCLERHPRLMYVALCQRVLLSPSNTQAGSRSA